MYEKFNAIQFSDSETEVAKEFDPVSDDAPPEQKIGEKCFITYDEEIIKTVEYVSEHVIPLMEGDFAKVRFTLTDVDGNHLADCTDYKDALRTDKDSIWINVGNSEFLPLGLALSKMKRNERASVYFSKRYFRNLNRDELVYPGINSSSENAYDPMLGKSFNDCQLSLFNTKAEIPDKSGYYLSKLEVLQNFRALKMELPVIESKEVESSICDDFSNTNTDKERQDVILLTAKKSEYYRCCGEDDVLHCRARLYSAHMMDLIKKAKSEDSLLSLFGIPTLLDIVADGTINASQFIDFLTRVWNIKEGTKESYFHKPKKDLDMFSHMNSDGTTIGSFSIGRKSELIDKELLDFSEIPLGSDITVTTEEKCYRCINDCWIDCDKWELSNNDEICISDEISENSQEQWICKSEYRIDLSKMNDILMAALSELNSKGSMIVQTGDICILLELAIFSQRRSIISEGQAIAVYESPILTIKNESFYPVLENDIVVCDIFVLETPSYADIDIPDLCYLSEDNQKHITNLWGEKLSNESTSSVWLPLGQYLFPPALESVIKAVKRGITTHVAIPKSLLSNKQILNLRGGNFMSDDDYCKIGPDIDLTEENVFKPEVEHSRLVTIPFWQASTDLYFENEGDIANLCYKKVFSYNEPKIDSDYIYFTINVRCSYTPPDVYNSPPDMQLLILTKRLEFIREFLRRSQGDLAYEEIISWLPKLQSCEAHTQLLEVNTCNSKHVVSSFGIEKKQFPVSAEWFSLIASYYKNLSAASTDLNEKIQACKKGLILEPKNLKIHARLIKALLESDLPEKALDQFNTIDDINEEGPDIATALKLMKNDCIKRINSDLKSSKKMFSKMLKGKA